MRWCSSVGFGTQFKHIPKNKSFKTIHFLEIFQCNLHARWVGIIGVQNNLKTISGDNLGTIVLRLVGLYGYFDVLQRDPKVLAHNNCRATIGEIVFANELRFYCGSFYLHNYKRIGFYIFYVEILVICCTKPNFFNVRVQFLHLDGVIGI